MDQVFFYQQIHHELVLPKKLDSQDWQRFFKNEFNKIQEFLSLGEKGEKKAADKDFVERKVI